MKIEVRIGGFQSIGIQADSYGTLLVPVLLSKLPDDVKLEISREAEDSKWNLDDLLKKLIAEITTKARCTTTAVNPAIAFGPKKPAIPTTNKFLAPNGGESEVGVPSAWGYTSMLIVERLSVSQKGNRLLRDLDVALFASHGDATQFVVILRRNVIVVDAIIQNCIKVNLKKVEMKTEYQTMHRLVGRRNQSLIRRFM